MSFQKYLTITPPHNRTTMTKNSPCAHQGTTGYAAKRLTNADQRWRRISLRALPSLVM